MGLTFGPPKPISDRSAYRDWSELLLSEDPGRLQLGADTVWEPVYVTSELDREAFFERVEEAAPAILYDPIEQMLNPPDEAGSERIGAVLYLKDGDRDHALFTSGAVRVHIAGHAVDLANHGTTRPGVPEPRENVPQGGTIVGVIDDGLGFLNARFRATDERTRIAALWLQSAKSAIPSQGVHLGRILSWAEIDRLIAATASRPEVSIYREVADELHPPGMPSSTLRRASHGSHVMDLAAGAEPGDGELASVPILGVQLAPDVFNDTSGAQLAIPLIQGLRWMVAVARAHRAASLVVNVSLGFLAGPKDGSSVVEQVLADIVARAARKIDGHAVKVTVVLPFGNDYEDRQVARLTVQPDEAARVGLRLARDDHTPSYVEVRTLRDEADATGGVAIGLGAPDGTVLNPTEIPGGNACDILLDGVGIGRVYHVGPAERLRPDGPPIRSHFVLAVRPTAVTPANPPVEDARRVTFPPGLWKLVIATSRPGGDDVVVQIQRDDSAVGYLRRGRQPYFEDERSYEWTKADRDYTALGDASVVGHPGTNSALVSHVGGGIFAVGAAVMRGPDGGPGPVPARTASEGGDWTRREPDMAGTTGDSALLPGVLASGTVSNSAVRLAGSSVAAASVTRHLALGTGKLVPVPETFRSRLGPEAVADNPAIRGRR